MMSGESYGRTIQLFLVDGTPNGLRKASIHGWTGVVIVSNQANFAKLRNREEVDRTGIYILTGPDPEKPGAIRAYIGSANSVRDRIKQSAEKREFWETAIAVTTSDDDLSKGHAEYLEARLIELANQAARVNLDNSTQPDTRRRRLPEADAANMEQFIANLKIVLPIIGLDLLKPQPHAISQPEERAHSEKTESVVFEIRHKSGVNATAVEEDGEFIVLEGSEALTGTGYVQKVYGNLKQQLIEGGVLVEHEKGKLRFSKSYNFRSPSAAAAVVLDRNSNGRQEWKVRGAKQTYADWQEAQAKMRGAQQ